MSRVDEQALIREGREAIARKAAATAEDVKAALRRRHGSESASGEWVCVEEAFSGWASMGGGIDLLAIGVWPTAKAPGLPDAGKVRHIDPLEGTTLDLRNPLVAYEVKISRSDFRRELYGYQPKKGWRNAVPPWPGKAMPAMERTHYFMFAVPAGLLQPHELERRDPWDEDGEAQLPLAGVKPRGRMLYVPREAGLVEITDAGCRVVHQAPPREARPLTVHETAELIRHAVDPNRDRAVRADNAYLRSRVRDLTMRLNEIEAAA